MTEPTLGRYTLATMADSPEGRVRALCERIRAVPWLSPDAEMDTLAEPAHRWIDERIDEHRAALAPWLPSTSGLPSPALAVVLTRSAEEARVRSGHGREARELVPFSEAAVAWHDALVAVHNDAERDARTKLGTAVVRAALDEVWRALCDASGATVPRPKKNPDDPGEDIVIGTPGGEAMIAHALTLLAGDDRPSPWAPLLSLWERGVATLASPEGDVVVYVPTQPEAKRAREAARTFENTLRLSQPFTIGIHPPSPFDRQPRASDGGNARAMLKGFNRLGFGPLVGMYTPTDVSFPMATNWPGPPDLFVVRPPPPSVAPRAQGEGTDGPPMLPGEAKREVPWYRKVFKRGPT